MYFIDTHCHLNFKTFFNREIIFIKNAAIWGVKNIVIPATNIPTSKKAVALAKKFSNLYAAVGIHPYHVYQYQKLDTNNQNYKLDIKNDLNQIEKLISSDSKVVAIGEIGLDRHYYQKTRYQDYQINKNFINLQKEVFIEQIKLAHRHNKAIIIHNRLAKKDLLEILTDYRQLIADYRSVFHCCEPEEELLSFATKNKIYIGVDGDITYNKKKQEFIKKVPLSLLVLETDSPFLIPEPLKSEKIFPNQPANLKLIAEFIAKLLDVNIEKLAQITTENSKKLFQLN